MFKQSALLLLATMAISSMAMPEPFDVSAALSDEYIEKLNTIQSSWKAGRNFDANIDPEFIRGLMGTLIEGNPSPLPVAEEEAIVGNLPESFDSRTAWPKCKTIGQVRDQSECGSCWAFGAVEAISDRICIASNQEQNPIISAQDLLSCCHTCGMGCSGGYPSTAWSYWVHSGLVTGGLYGDKSTCRPYGFPECEHHTTGSRPPCKGSRATPRCEKQCQSGYAKSYNQDLHFGQKTGRISRNVQQIQNQIMNHGPVEASFTVYSDFLSYKSGVYVSTSSQALGGHAIKVIGWGKENGKDYWLCVNSWNEDWGDKGLFKILRGHNHCGIESDIEFGTPKLN